MVGDLSVGGPIIYVPPPVEISLFTDATAVVIDVRQTATVMSQAQTAAVVESSRSVAFVQTPGVVVSDAAKTASVTDPSTKVTVQED
jgi:hypothetical protein